MNPEENRIPFFQSWIRYLAWCTLALFLSVSCKERTEPAETGKTEVAGSPVSDSALVTDYSRFDIGSFREFRGKQDGIVHVVNFWATWCAPCLEEIPYFETLPDSVEGRKIEVLLVSLDFPSTWPRVLPAFVERQGFRSEVAVVDEPELGPFLRSVDPDWENGIPATLIFRDGEEWFARRAIDSLELRELVRNLALGR